MKERFETTSKFKIHHLGHWKRDLWGKFFIPQVSDHSGILMQICRRMKLIPKGRGYPVKELKNKRHFVQPLELGDSLVKGEFNAQHEINWNLLEARKCSHHRLVLGSTWGVGRLRVLSNPQYRKYRIENTGYKIQDIKSSGCEMQFQLLAFEGH